MGSPKDTGADDRAIVGQVDAQAIPRFAGLSTFARLPRAEDVADYDVAVVGVPFDSGVTYRPGARFGPSAIRQASRLLRPYNPALDTYPFRQRQVVDAGDLGVTPFDVTAAIESIDAGLDEVATRAGKPLVILGGDHTIALPALRMFHRRHGPLALVHFDAHLDTWDTYFGMQYTHGSPFRRAWEEGLLRPDACVHVGTRGSVYGAADLDDDRSFGFTIVTADTFDTTGTEEIAGRLRERVVDGPLYVSIDIDVLDPAHAPGTGTPEAGGLTSREVLSVTRGLRGLSIVGADIVEVAPAYDHAEVTAIAAANIVYELVSLLTLGDCF